MNDLVYITVVVLFAAGTYWYVRRKVGAGRKRAEDALRESEARFQELYDRSPDMMATVDVATGRVVRCNRTLAEALGLKSGEVIGRSVFDLYDPGSVEDARRALRQLVETGELHNTELVLRRAGGAAIDVSLNMSGVSDAEGRIVRARLVLHDITVRKRAEEKLGELHEALEHAVEGIARLDGQERFVSVNPAYAAMHGYRPCELVGTDRRATVHPEDLPALDGALRSMNAEGTSEVDLRGVRKDGSIFYHHSTIVAIRGPDGRISGRYSFIKDVTQRKIGERQLRDSLARQNELLRREKTLLRELSHRVRNNLAGLLGLVGLYERSGKNAQEIARSIRGKVRAMKEVHDMISRAHGTPVDLAVLVARLTGEGMPEGHGERFRVSGPPVDVPHAQAVALAMLVQELMTNSQKYGSLSADGGRVTISWSHVDQDEQRAVRFTWEEDGGPAPVARPPQGVGLGLIGGLAGAELQGHCRFNFASEGLRFELLAVLTDAPVPAPVSE